MGWTKQRRQVVRVVGQLTPSPRESNPQILKENINSCLGQDKVRETVITNTFSKVNLAVISHTFS